MRLAGVLVALAVAGVAHADLLRSNARAGGQQKVSAAELLQISEKAGGVSTPEEIIKELNTISTDLSQTVDSLETSEDKLTRTYGKEKVKLDAIIVQKLGAVKAAGSVVEERENKLVESEMVAAEAKGAVEGARETMESLQGRFEHYVGALRSAEVAYMSAKHQHTANIAELKQTQEAFDELIRTVHGGASVVRRTPVPAAHVEGEDGRPAGRANTPEEAAEEVAEEAAATGAHGKASSEGDAEAMERVVRAVRDLEDEPIDHYERAPHTPAAGPHEVEASLDLPTGATAATGALGVSDEELSEGERAELALKDEVRKGESAVDRIRRAQHEDVLKLAREVELGAEREFASSPMPTGATGSATGSASGSVSSSEVEAAADQGARDCARAAVDGLPAPEGCTKSVVNENAEGAYVAETTEDVEVVEPPRPTAEVEPALLELVEAVRAHARGDRAYACPKGYCVRATLYAEGAGPAMECFNADAVEAQATLPAEEMSAAASTDEYKDTTAAPMCGQLLQEAKSATEQRRAVALSSTEYGDVLEKIVADSQATLLSGDGSESKFAAQEDILLYSTRAVAIVKSQLEARSREWHQSMLKLHEYRETVLPVLNHMMQRFRALHQQLEEEVEPKLSAAQGVVEERTRAVEAAKADLRKAQKALNRAMDTVDRVDELYESQIEAISRRADHTRSQLLLATEVRESLKSRMKEVQEITVSSFEKAKADLAEATKEEAATSQ